MWQIREQDDAAMLARVVVLSNRRGHAAPPSYTYVVPEALMGRLVPGQLVLVPFGSRLVPAIVWDVPSDQPAIADPGAATNLPHVAGAADTADGDDPASGEQWRPLRELVDETPLLGQPHRALAEWLADHYACSLAAAAALMLPPGLLRGTRVLLRPAGAAEVVSDDAVDASTSNPVPGDALASPAADVVGHGSPRDDAALLGALRVRGHLDERTLADALGAQRAQAAVTALVARGAARRTAVVPSLAGGPRREQWLRLIAPAEALAAWRTAARAELSGLPDTPHSSGSPVATGQRVSAVRHDNGGDTVPGGASSPRDRRSEQRAERLLRQLAVLDLLARSPAPERGTAGSVGAALGAWRLSEIRRLTRATHTALDDLVAAGLVAVETLERWHDPLAGRAISRNAPLPLTQPQTAALAAILAPCAPDAPGVVLLHGITGSGKTEVYLQALAAQLEAGRRGIVLVPEIALTPQAMMRYAGRFPGRVALLHSGLSDAERLDEWRRIRAGLVDVVVGSRSALFAPVERLGLIVVDEEHELAYKQEGRAPTYHARDAAVMLGRLTSATVVLGSATPSVESYYHARQGDYRLVELRERAPAGKDQAASALPPVAIVDLRAELRAGNTSILGGSLQRALAETLDAGQQAVLFLNRRGTASCVICRECGYVALCGRCDVPMTFHASDRALICHYCGKHQPAPRSCPHCGGASIRYFGLGTERVEAAVRRLHPRARVLRWDRDTARTRQAHEELLAAFAGRRADVLVGTQMIAKGLDLPAVTLVGVVSADIALYLPDFRAGERAFQLLTQVAGRAGRGEAPGRVIIQTFNPDHFCIQAAARHDYHEFYRAEISARQAYGYPPLRQFVKFTYSQPDRHRAQVEAVMLAERLEAIIRERALSSTDLVGPAPAFMERLRGQYRWQLIARGPDLRPMLHALTTDDLPRGWSVDVDPASTL